MFIAWTPSHTFTLGRSSRPWSDPLDFSSKLKLRYLEVIRRLSAKQVAAYVDAEEIVMTTLRAFAVVSSVGASGPMRAFPVRPSARRRRNTAWARA